MLSLFRTSKSTFKPAYRILFLVGVFLILVFLCCQEQPQKQKSRSPIFLSSSKSYPVKSVTLVAPWGRGGSSDKASRIFASVAPKYLGQQVIVENRTGDGGLLGANYVHKAKGDGYTLLLARIGCITGPASIRDSMPFQYNDFTMLGLLEINPLVLVVRADSPYKTLDELLGEIKKSPGKLSYAISGKGNVQHLSVLKLLDLAGVKEVTTQAVPAIYDGGGGVMLRNLLDKKADFSFSNFNAVYKAMESGELRPLLVNSPRRHPLLPEIVTTHELGYTELGPVVGWSALFGPPDMDPDAINEWRRVLRKVKEDSSWITKIEQEGSIPMILTSKGTEKFVKEQYEILHNLIQKLGLKGK